MFINALVFINSSVVYKPWGGGGGVLEHKLKSPHHPPPPLARPPRFRYGIYDLRMCVTVTVLCGFSFTQTGPRSPKCLRISPTFNT